MEEKREPLGGVAEMLNDLKGVGNNIKRKEEFQVRLAFLDTLTNFTEIEKIETHVNDSIIKNINAVDKLLETYSNESAE